ncbi:MAG: hypothetical protein MRJ96_10170 [Nitrospirales bacterium]|nr:hypothetical protein [Nitrospira sp.]MDR4501803.1 hypothetical protein [Nitrospirales bacterium]
MKHRIFSGSLVFSLVMAVGTAGYAGNYDEFIHLVKHRDVHGNLVVPESSDALKDFSPPQTVSSFEQEMGHEAVTETDKREPHNPESESVSHHNPEMADSAMGAYDKASGVYSADQALNSGSEALLQKTMLPTPTRRYVFLGASWGMSIPEVKTKETAKLSWELDARVLMPGEHRLGYQTRIVGIDAFLTYGFEHDRLNTSKYYFETEEEENDAQPLLNYKKVKNWIAQIYGPPQNEEKIWLNELYQYAPELWGRALKRGHLTIVDQWHLEGTSVILLLNGGEEGVSLIAEFSHSRHDSSADFVQLLSSFLTS